MDVSFIFSCNSCGSEVTATIWHDKPGGEYQVVISQCEDCTKAQYENGWAEGYDKAQERALQEIENEERMR